MKKTVDARGLSDMQPAYLTIEALTQDHVKEVLTIVDNADALENVAVMLKELKVQSTVDEKGGHYYININKDVAAGTLGISRSMHGDIVVFITSNVLGHGDDKLGSILMKSFIYTLTQLEGMLKSVIFINSGVLLTTNGSDVLEYIKVLEERGIEILSSAACLDYYHLTDKLGAGIITNMFTITEKIMEGPRVITV